jgi:hypothetical protein
MLRVIGEIEPALAGLVDMPMAGIVPFFADR